MLRRGDGAEVVARVSPYPLLLHQLLADHQWDKATKLCYAIKVALSVVWLQSLLLDSLQSPCIQVS